MAPATGTAILVLAGFVLPGFITLLIRERTYVVPGEDSTFERLLNALTLSAIVYAIVLAAAMACRLERRDVGELYDGGGELWQYAVLGAAGLLLIPAAVAESGRRWHVSRWRQRALRWLGIDETHATPATNSRGLWIDHTSIRSIEFYAPSNP